MALFARVVAWFNGPLNRAWTERAYFPGVRTEGEAVARGAEWVALRAQLLAPGPVLVAASVGMEDTARDSLYLSVPSPRFTAGGTGGSGALAYYNPETVADGPTDFAWTSPQVIESAFDGRATSITHLRGVANSYTVNPDGFVPSPAWQSAWRRFSRLVTGGVPPENWGGGGPYGFKCQVLDEAQALRVRLAGSGFGAPGGPDGAQWFRARGHGLKPGDYIRIGWARGIGVQPNGTWHVVAVPDPDTFTTDQPGPGFRWVKFGYVRRILYQIAPTQKIALGPVVGTDRAPHWHPLTWEYASGRRPPIDPCGKVVTWGREPGPPGAFRFFRDSEDETLVQWRLADCAALPLTMYHVFGSQVYMDRPSGPWLHVGEVEHRRHGPREHRPSAYPGVCHLGTDAQWRSGCLTTDPLPPVPPCCVAAVRDVSVIIIGTDSGWGTVVTLLVEQYDGTGQVPTVTTLDFDQASRLVVDSLGSGHAGVRWLGVRGYHAGDGYFGPQPDIEFLDGGGVAWTVTEDAVNKRIVIGAVASGGGGGAGLTYGTATDESAYTLTTTGARTGWTVTLPDPGRYFLWAHARIDASAPRAAGLVQFSLSLVNATTPANLVLPSNGVGCTYRFAPGDLDTVVATVPVAGYLVTTTPNEVIEVFAFYEVLTGVAPAVLELLGSSVALQYLRLDGPGGGTPGPPGPPGPPGSMTLGTTPVTGGTPGEFLVVGPGGTLSQSPGGGGGSLGIGTTPVAGGTPGDVLTVGPDGSLGQVTAPSGTPTGPAGGDLGGTFPNAEVVAIDGGTWE